MVSTTRQWWRRARVAGATTALFLAAGCGGSSATPGPPSSGPCSLLPASDVPPMQRALTERNHGTYCASRGVTILIVLKGRDFTAANAWSSPDVTGPDNGVSVIAPPLTSLRGTTVAAVALTAAGQYTFRSTTPAHDSWQAVVNVS